MKTQLGSPPGLTEILSGPIKVCEVSQGIGINESEPQIFLTFLGVGRERRTKYLSHPVQRRQNQYHAYKVKVKVYHVVQGLKRKLGSGI